MQFQQIRNAILFPYFNITITMKIFHTEVSILGNISQKPENAAQYDVVKNADDYKQTIGYEKNCLVNGFSELVNDADVRCPSDRERQVEVDDARDKHVVVVESWIASESSGTATDTQFGPDDNRNVERDVVNPNVNDDRGRNACFEATSARLRYSRVSAKHLRCRNTVN